MEQKKLSSSLVGPYKSARMENYFYYFSTYVMGTQKNGLDETVILSTQNLCWNWYIKK